MAAVSWSLPGLDADILDALGITALQGPAATDPFEDVPRGLAAAGRTPPDEPLVEALLHEFHRVLADPSQLISTADWPAHAARHRQRAPDFDALGTLAAPYVHLRDLVMPPMSVDGCIGSFDADLHHLPGTPDRSADLFIPPVPPEVLRLFAPDAPPAGPPVALPGETRRDHHLPTTDTAIRAGRFAPAASRPTPEPRHGQNATST